MPEFFNLDPSLCLDFAISECYLKTPSYWANQTFDLESTALSSFEYYLKIVVRQGCLGLSLALCANHQRIRYRYL